LFIMGLRLKRRLSSGLRHAARARLGIFKRNNAALRLLNNHRSVGRKVGTRQVHVLSAIPAPCQKLSASLVANYSKMTVLFP
jgi:hypothetical protein